MFSRQYLDELDMQIERTRRAYKWSQAMVLGMAVLLLLTDAKDRFPTLFLQVQP